MQAIAPRSGESFVGRLQVFVFVLPFPFWFWLRLFGLGFRLPSPFGLGPACQGFLLFRRFPPLSWKVRCTGFPLGGFSLLAAALRSCAAERNSGAGYKPNGLGPVRFLHVQQMMMLGGQVLVCFSLFVQMAEGTSYGIVPFMNRPQLAVVSALVGAGGNLGAVIAGFCFYRPIDDPLLPFQVHAGYVMFWALLSPCYYWAEHGGMFHGPKEVTSEKTIGETQA